jgi:hypothetical protein
VLPSVTYKRIETVEFQEAEEFLMDARHSLHQDRSELPRPKTMTNAWPKTDEIRSARPRRVKMTVAIKLYSQIIARITFCLLYRKTVFNF